MSTFSFKRGERLKSRKIIKSLFSKGQSFAAYPLRLVWIKLEGPNLSEYPVQFALTVPKKKFSKAAHRNRLRRRIREAWRLNKTTLYRSIQKGPDKYAFMIIYTAKEELPYGQIETAMKKLISRFKKIHKHNRIEKA